MLFKRCDHSRAQRRECEHPWWIRVKRKKKAISESLEVYFEETLKTTQSSVRGRGAFTLARSLERKFITDVDEGRYAEWKAKQRGFEGTDITIERLRDLYKQDYIVANNLHWGPTHESFYKRVVRTWNAAPLWKTPTVPRPASTISLRDVEAIIAPLKIAKRAPNTIRTAAMNIHRWLKWGARRGYLAAVPFSWADEDLRLPKKGTARSQLLSVDAERALRQPGVMSDFLTAAVDVTLATGLRKNTLRLLQLEDIRWDRGAHGELHIPPSKMKGRNASVKELTPASAKALKSRMEFYLARGVLKPQTFLFGKEDGTELNEKAFPINKHWGRAKRAAKLPTQGAESVTFHDLRATAACRLYRRMGRIDVVMRFLDHTSLEMTQNYLRAHLGELEEVANVMSAVEAETQAALAAGGGVTKGVTVIPMKGRKSR